MPVKRHNPLWNEAEAAKSAGAKPSALPQSPATLATSQLPAILKRDGAHAPKPHGRNRSFADLLSRLYQQFDDLADEIATSNEPPLKRAEALKSLAKTLPLLKAAEDSANVKLKNKAITEMSDDELERVISQARDKGRFPLQDGNGAGSTDPFAKKQKSDSDDVGSLTTSCTEDDEDS